MTSNTALIAVKDRGRLDGFGPLWRKESHAWWGTWSWLVKVLMWVAIIDGILLMATVAGPKIEAAESGQVVSQSAESLEQTSLMVFFLMTAMLPAAYVIIFGENTLIDERKLGTAAWVLSKPVSRASFLLSKLAANAVGILVVMVLVPGFIAYIIHKAITGISLSIPGFLAGLGLVYLFVIFFLALTMMLNTLFHSRGPVIGIPLALISCTFLARMSPWLGKVMPANLFMSVTTGQSSLAEALARGQPLLTVTPIIITGLLTILFIAVALVRFEREEF